MPWEPWLTIVVVLLMVLALMRHLAGPDTVLLGGLTLLMTLSLFSPKFPTPRLALSGFGSSTVVTIAVLFVVAEGLRQTGAMSLVTERLLGRPKGLRGAQARLMAPVAVMSAFLNNTPIVAMFIPVVNDWCKKTGMSPSKLFIPLSYAAILGGTCTLIGTVTNIYVADQLEANRAHYAQIIEDATTVEANQRPRVVDGQVKTLAERKFEALESASIEMFTIARVGVPAALFGIAYVLLLGHRWLPDRRRTPQDLADARQYTVEMLVEPGSPVAGKSIEQAGLRHLPGAYLMDIEREGERIVAVGPEQVLHAGDRLIFVGVVESVRDLQRIRGLVPATDQVFKLADPRPNRRLVEAVVSHTCPLVGMSIRQGRFRTNYNAAVIAVHRGGQHLANQKIGDIVLQAGDTLLIETHPRFVEQHRNRQDFFLVSAVADSKPMGYERAWVALAILAAMVAVISVTPVKLVNAALWAGGLMVVTRCCSGQEARASINWRVLLTLGAAIGVGSALDSTGAAQIVADFFIDVFAPLGPPGVLAAVYLMGMLFNSMIGPIGSAALVFPVSLASAAELEVPFMPFAIVVMMAASASFATPLAYQTNLMVYGPGGYRFGDYIRFGLPLNFLLMAVTVTLAVLYWPLQ